jgi:hypothetical protein
LELKKELNLGVIQAYGKKKQEPFQHEKWGMTPVSVLRSFFCRLSRILLAFGTGFSVGISPPFALFGSFVSFSHVLFKFWFKKWTTKIIDILETGNWGAGGLGFPDYQGPDLPSFNNTRSLPQ